jgi:hypothetical protein
MSRDSIRAKIEALDMDYVGQEGRGAAKSVQGATLHVLEVEWAAEDAAEERRQALIKALADASIEAANGIPGIREPKYLGEFMAGALAMFVLSVDDRTWQAVAGDTDRAGGRG